MESAKENAPPVARHEDQKPLVQEIIQLSDDFGEFSHVSAFLWARTGQCAGRTRVARHDIIAGGRLCSNWLQKRTSQLRDEMRHVRGTLHR
jgi:hypothetical protein